MASRSLAFINRKNSDFGWGGRYEAVPRRRDGSIRRKDGCEELIVAERSSLNMVNDHHLYGAESGLQLKAKLFV